MVCDLLIYSLLSQSSCDENFLSPCSIPSASLSMLLYLLSAFDRLLLANVMGPSMLLSGALSLWSACTTSGL